MSERSHGFTLVELLIGIAVIGLAVAITTPAILTSYRHAATRAAAGEIGSIFNLCRSRAIATGRNSGVRFVKQGVVWMAELYDDGNGDGIRTQDIAKGIDRKIAPARRAIRESDVASISLPPVQIVDPDGEKLAAGSSPVKFNTSSIASFSPLGAGTPGSVYLSDHYGEIWVLRVTGSTGRVTLLRYDAFKKTWSRR